MVNNKVDIYSLADIIFNKRTFSDSYFLRGFSTKILGALNKTIYAEEHVITFEEKEFFFMIQAYTLNIKSEDFFHVVFNFKPKNEEDFEILTLDKVKDYLKSEFNDFKILNYNNSYSSEEQKVVSWECYISKVIFKDFYFRFSILEHFEKTFNIKLSEKDIKNLKKMIFNHFISAALKNNLDEFLKNLGAFENEISKDDFERIELIYGK